MAVQIELGRFQAVHSEAAGQKLYSVCANGRKKANCLPALTISWVGTFSGICIDPYQDRAFGVPLL
jgi:hypothetical protein